MKLNKVIIRDEELVLLGYAFLLLAEVLYQTELIHVISFRTIQLSLKSAAMALVCASFLIKRKINKGSLFFIIMLVGLVGLIVQSTQMVNARAVTLLFLLGGLNLHTDRILVVFYRMIAVIMVITIGCVYLNIYKSDMLIGSRERYYLGFTYASFSANYFFHAVLAYFFSKKRPISLKDTGVVLAVNLYLFVMTDTKAVYYEIYLLLGLLWLLRFRPNLFSGRGWRIIQSLSGSVLAAVIIYLSAIYTPYNPTLKKLDKLLSSRLTLGKMGIERYGIHIFGSRKIEWATGRYGIERTKEYFYVDSSYLNIALTWGVLFLIIVLIAFAVYNLELNRKGKHECCAVVMMLLLHSFSDPQMLELRYDPFVILAFGCLLRTVYEKEKRKIVFRGRPREKKIPKT